jgi:serine protease inhibitor
MPMNQTSGRFIFRVFPLAFHCRDWTRIGGLCVLLAVCSFELDAQEAPQSQPAMFVRANDSFALDLLKKTHDDSPERNIVVAPLPVSVIFSALWDGTRDVESAKEFRAAFHWDKDFATPMGGKMLLTRFARPKPYPKSHRPPPKDSTLLRYMQSGKAEELWLSAAFLYRGEGSLSQDFIDRVTYDFGLSFRGVGGHTPQSEILAKNWDTLLPMPKVIGPNDFWITSFTHLRTSWAGNTFMGGKREKRDFHLRSGDMVQADFLKSEFENYPYARTEEFEAVVLTCWQATILLVLPSADSTIEQLEASYAKNPNLIEPLLARREGDVRLSPFHFSFEANLRNSLEKMGVHRIFDDQDTLLAMAPQMAGGILRGVAQKTEITVDENGIRADAGTIFHGVYGGVLGVRSPFHMTLDRPFLFIVRDNVTRALLFAGVVMNPTLQ